MDMIKRIENGNKVVMEIYNSISKMHDTLIALVADILWEKVGNNKWLEINYEDCCYLTFLNGGEYLKRIKVDDGNIVLNDEYEGTYYDLCIEDKIEVYECIVNNLKLNVD